MKDKLEKKIFLWLAGNLLIQIGVPAIFYFYLSRQLDYEYAHGLRTSTDGDSIAIPVFGMTVFVFIALIAINIMIACYYFLHRRKRLA